MRTFLSTSALALFAVATPVFAGDGGVTERLGGYGPAFWEIPCGLPCFAMADAAGVQPGELNYTDLQRIQTVADMQAWLDDREVRLAAKEGSAATGGTAPAKR